MFLETIPFFEMLKVAAVFALLGFVLRNFVFDDFNNAVVLKQWAYIGTGLVALVYVLFQGYTIMDIIHFGILYLVAVLFTPFIKMFMEYKFGYEFTD